MVRPFQNYCFVIILLLVSLSCFTNDSQSLLYLRGIFGNEAVDLFEYLTVYQVWVVGSRKTEDGSFCLGTSCRDIVLGAVVVVVRR